MKTISKSYGLQEGRLKITLEISEDAVNRMDKKKLRNILGSIAGRSRNFYLEAGRSLSMDFINCPKCGMALCKKGKEKDFEDSYCIHCGAKLPDAVLTPGTGH